MENEYLFYNKACKTISEIVDESFFLETVNIMEEKKLPQDNWECGIYYLQYAIKLLNEFTDSKLSQRDIIEMISTVFTTKEEYWNTITNPNKEVYLAFRDGFMYAARLNSILSNKYGMEVLPY